MQACGESDDGTHRSRAADVAVAGAGDFYVDVAPPMTATSAAAPTPPSLLARRSSAVSISSVDSEPLAPRPLRRRQRGGSTRRAQRGEARRLKRPRDECDNMDRGDGGDAVVNKTSKEASARDVPCNDDDCDTASDSDDATVEVDSVASDAESEGDAHDAAAMVQQSVWRLDETAAEAAAVAANITPHTYVAASRLSEAHLATVTSVMAREAVLVAESAEDGIAVDTGTLLYTSDGCAVGVVASLLGPVRRVMYVVACVAARLTDATKDGCEESIGIAPGVRLHTDVTQQKIIFDVAAQCDVARGSDASYVNDEELPTHVRPDFSDDEAEMRWKREQRQRGNGADNSLSSDDDVQDTAVDVDWDRIALEEQALVATSEHAVKCTTTRCNATTEPHTVLHEPKWLK